VCILVVEDEVFIRLIVSEELEEAGFEVCQAANGDEAARLISDSTRPFTMMITDIHMPGQLDGLQLATIMRGRFPAAPIVYTTGRPDVVAELESLRDNDVLLSKPFVPSKLLGLVRQLLHSPK
jgi:DNA-binding response OmpR family regulator